MDILVGVTGETEKSLQSEWYFYPSFIFAFSEGPCNTPPCGVMECGLSQELSVAWFDCTANESSQHLRNKHRAAGWSCPLSLDPTVEWEHEFGELQIGFSSSLPGCSSALHWLPSALITRGIVLEYIMDDEARNTWKCHPSDSLTAWAVPCSSHNDVGAPVCLQEGLQGSPRCLQGMQFTPEPEPLFLIPWEGTKTLLAHHLVRAARRRHARKFQLETSIRVERQTAITEVAAISAVWCSPDKELPLDVSSGSAQMREQQTNDRGEGGKGKFPWQDSAPL